MVLGDTSFLYLFSLFIIYSFLGWVVETIYCSAWEGRFVYRGFLNGPICPIYGFGALAVLFLLRPFHDSGVIILFIASVLVTSVLEYITSYVLEKLFDMKWWDYSDKKWNINGRVCALNSFLFGCLSVIFLKVIHPEVASILNRFSQTQLQFISFILLPVFVFDFILTVYNLLDLKSRLAEYENYIELKFAGKLEEQIAKFEDLKINFSNRRIFKSYNMKSIKHPKAITNIKDYLRELKEERKKDKKED